MRNTSTMIHMEPGDRLNVHRLDGCGETVSVGYGTALGFSLFFESREEAVMSLKEVVALLEELPDADGS